LQFKPSIIYEDENFLAIDKPTGMLVEQVKAVGKVVPENREEVLQGWLEKHYAGARAASAESFGRVKLGFDAPRLVHRLDRETSGIILAAKNQEQYDYFKQLFKDRTIKKTYLALVNGHLNKKRGVIDAAIGLKAGMVRHTIYDTKKEKRSSITKYRVISEYTYGGEQFSLLEAYPKTGRTHQIRVHLNSIHHPVVGDKLYGGDKKQERAHRHMLHAQSLEFSLKEGGRIKLEADMPDDFEKVLAQFTKTT